MDFIGEFLKSAKEGGKINSTTLELYRRDIEDFDGFIIGKDLIDVTSQDVVNFVEELEKRYSDMSIQRKLSSLKSFYKYLLKSRIIDKNPLSEVEIKRDNKKITPTLAGWEIKKIIDVASDTYEDRRDTLIIRLIVETGFKIGDILNIHRDTLRVYDYKMIRGKKEAQPISEKLSLDLKNFVEDVQKDNIEKENLRIFGELSREAFRVRFIRLGKLAGINGSISPSMIKKVAVENKLKDEKGLSLDDKIRLEYMRIGIGDD